MPFSGFPNQEQLSILKQAREQYCRDCGIVSEQDREHVGLLVMSLFETGVTSLDGLMAGLHVALGGDLRQQPNALASEHELPEPEMPSPHQAT